MDRSGEIDAFSQKRPNLGHIGAAKNPAQKETFPRKQVLFWAESIFFFVNGPVPIWAA
jgi:hypothetical protein